VKKKKKKKKKTTACWHEPNSNMYHSGTNSGSLILHPPPNRSRH